MLNRARREGIYPRIRTDHEPDPTTIANIAKAFQDSVIDVLVTKTIRAAEEFGCSAIVLVGGVAANRPLRETMSRTSPLPVVTPPIPLCTDNGAMIAPRRIGPVSQRSPRRIRVGRHPVPKNRLNAALPRFTLAG